MDLPPRVDRDHVVDVAVGVLGVVDVGHPLLELAPLADLRGQQLFSLGLELFAVLGVHAEDLAGLDELCRMVRDMSLCGLGQSAANPFLSTLRYFRDEDEAHIKEKRCPALSCKELISYWIDPEKCKGCTLCAKKCPNDAILGTAKSPHYIVPDKCVGCGSCVDTCRFDAVIVE